VGWILSLVKEEKLTRMLKIGERWGHLEVTDRGADPIMATDQYQRQYATGESGPTWVLLRCECGRTFRIFEHEFLGKRKLRTCGQCELDQSIQTEHRPLGRPRAAERGQSVVLYLKPSFVAEVDQYAQEQRISLSKAFREIAELGLEALRRMERVEK
jgi:hypothetical protein